MPSESSSLGQVLDMLAKEYPKFAEEIYSGSGIGDYFYSLFLNDQLVSLAEREDVVARDGDEIFIVLPIAGGQAD